jgi:hypothetical protein
MNVSDTTSSSTYAVDQAFECAGGGKFAGNLWVKDGKSLVVGDDIDTGTERLRIHHFTDNNSYIDYGSGNLIFRNSGATTILTLNSSGSVSASGDLNVSGTKNFKIPHPHPSKTETHNLVHSAVEAPAADLLYRGTVTMPSSTTTTVDMDSHAGMTAGTFELLTKNVQVFTKNESSWTLVRGSLSGATLHLIPLNKD